MDNRLDRRSRHGPNKLVKQLSSGTVVERVRAIYEELAAIPLVRQCQGRAQCCHFRLTGRIPYLTRGEAVLAAKAWRHTGRKRLPVRPDGSCPMLDPTGMRCLIYSDRPFSCRTHFCSAAGGPYARAEVRDLIHRLEQLDAELDGDGARRLPLAIADALEK